MLLQEGAPHALSSDMGGEEPAGKERSLREGEVGGKGGQHPARRGETVKEREKMFLALICGKPLLSISKFHLFLQQLQPPATA